MNDWPNVPPPPPIENSSPDTHPVKNTRGAEKNMVIFSGGSSFVPPDVTGQVQNTAQFQPGVSGNPQGRPKGSRNRFSELFMKTLVDDFAANGAEALAKLRTRDPEVYFRLIVSLVPKSLILKYEETRGIDYDNITEEEFLQLLNDLQRRKVMQQAVQTVSE